MKRKSKKGARGRKAPVSENLRALMALPFVNSPPGGGRLWWDVKTSGDFGADTERGREHALAFLRYLTESAGGTFSELGMIAIDQIAQGRPETREDRGIVLGFWWAISDALLVGGKAALARLPDYYAAQRADARAAEATREKEEADKEAAKKGGES